MSFEIAVISIAPASVGTGIKASLKKAKAGPAKLTLSFTGEAFRSMGWSADDKIVVQIGTGEHHGLIRLQKNNSTGQALYRVKEAVRGGRYGILALGHQPAFVDRSESSRWCQWEKLDTGEIEVVLPQWADETSPTKTKRAEPPAPAFPIRSIAKKETVTGSLMGDPAPGRSALDERNGR